MTSAIANKGNFREFYNDCSSTAPTGQVRYIPPNPAEVNQGKVVRNEAAVKKAQEALGMTGKDADGMWGGKTTEAAQRRIEQFQKDNGLEVTGRYNAETAEKMKKDPASKALGEALDGMRNRDLLDRVYKPMQKEVLGNDDASCRRDGASTGGPAQKPVQSTAPKTTAPDENDAETQRLRRAGVKPQDSMIDNAPKGMQITDTRRMIDEIMRMRIRIEDVPQFSPSVEGLTERYFRDPDMLTHGPHISPLDRPTKLDGFVKPADIGMMRDVGGVGYNPLSGGSLSPEILKSLGGQTGAPPTGEGPAKLSGGNTYVQPVAQMTRGADGKWGEAPEGAAMSGGRSYSPSLGGAVTKGGGMTDAEIRQGAARLGQMLDGNSPASAVLKNFGDNIGSIGSLGGKTPSAATPGFAPPEVAPFKIDAPKL